MSSDSTTARLAITLAATSLIGLLLAGLLALPGRQLRPDRSVRPFELDEPPIQMPAGMAPSKNR